MSIKQQPLSSFSESTKTKMDLSIGQPEVDFDSNILDVVVPKELEKSVKTGFKNIDTLFAGDGILPSTSALITGLPGAGKTTLMLQLADAITAEGHIALYNTGEESLYQVRRVVKRLNLRNGFIPGYNRTVQDIANHAEQLQDANPEKKIFLITDSLQTLEVEREEGKRGRNLSKQNEEVAAIEYLTRWAKDTFNISLCIGQVNKGGTFAGKQEVKHIIDCHLHLAYDTERGSSSYGERIAEMTKNRFGCAGVYYPYEISHTGISFSL